MHMVYRAEWTKCANQSSKSNCELHLVENTFKNFIDSLTCHVSALYSCCVQLVFTVLRCYFLLDTSAVEIDGEYEHIKLRSPSLAFFAAHLQTVCLAKNVFVNPHDIQALSSLYYPDIRRLLLCLQFWVDSFGGALDKHGIRIMDGSVDGSILSSGISSNNAVGNLHINSGNVKDEMNNDGLSTPCNDGKTQLSSKDGTSHPIELESSTIPTGSNEGNKSEVNQFSTHKYCLESLLGFGNISTTYENILDCLRPINKVFFVVILCLFHGVCQWFEPVAISYYPRGSF